MSDQRSEGFEVMEVEGGVPVKSWTRGVPFEDEARQQLRNVASLPFVHRWVAAMPDVHWGIGATVGSVTRSWAGGPGPIRTLGESASTLRVPSPLPSTENQRCARASA